MLRVVRRSIAPWAALAGSLLLTLAAAAFLFDTARIRDRRRFDRAASRIEDGIAARFETHAALLRSAAALLAADPGASPAQFRAFAARLELREHHGGLQGLGYARRVRRANSAQLEAELQREGFAGLRIWPDLGREERTAIVWLEPLDRRNRAAIGYDMLTEPVRREAMERACDTASPALSGKVTLVQEIDEKKQAGFLLYVPVYRGGLAPAKTEERRAALIGWAYEAFRADDLFNALLGENADPSIDVAVYDGPEEHPAHLLRDRAAPPGRLRTTMRMDIAGRQWTLAFAAVSGPEGSGQLPAALTLLGGIVISGILFLLSLREAQARRRAESALAELRESVEDRGRFEDRLREEGRVNSILRRLGISLAGELDPDRLAQLVAGEATALTGAELGAIFDPHRRLLAAAGPQDFSRLSLRADSETAARTLLGHTVRFDDLGKDHPVFGEGGPQVCAYLAVPIISRTGDVLAGLFFCHPATGHFSEQHERLVLGLAAQASIAFDNARLLRDLRDADRRKDEFLAVLGHELRNPLAPVVTALEVAKRDPATAQRQLGVIDRQARHMVRIVDDLLDVSRISRGKIELKRQTLSVNDAVLRAAEAVAPLARAREQKFLVSTPKEPLLIDADPVRLEQILGNLLTNAIKYTPVRGEVALSAEQRGTSLEITVRDSGIGIAPEAQAVLFQPFVQIAGAKDYATGGLGIGLALVKGLVELHGGTVAVASEGAGKGSLFTVRLPGAVRGRAPPEVPLPERQRARRGRVLVVDDNVDAATTLAEAMRFDGHEVLTAHDGPSAMEQAAAFEPDVVLLDIGLPGFDGYEVARRLRQLPALRKTLIVALTGFGQESDRERALQSGFDEHLVKPVDLDVVQAVLRRRLGDEEGDQPILPLRPP
jgi:signal transduction histidine kinase/CHASE1-domain containing sensor protein/ActR/RegA family two-component response regulator